MAKVGLSNPKFSVVTLNESSGTVTETYGTLTVFSKAVSANISINASETKFYADNAVAESVKEFIDGSISFVGDDIEDSVLAAITGATVDSTTSDITSKDDDSHPYVRFGYIVRRIKSGTTEYRGIVYTRVQFAEPVEEYETKGENIVFKSTSVTGTIMRAADKSWRKMSQWKSTEAAALTWLDSAVKPS